LAYVMYLIPRIIRDRLEMIRKIRNHFAHSPTPAKFTDAQCRDTLHILATGKFRVTETAEVVSNGGRKNWGAVFNGRFYFICAVAQTATIIELLESLLLKHGDIREIVLHSEKTGHLNMTKTPPNDTPEPTAAGLSVCARRGRFAGLRLRRRPVPSGCGSAPRSPT
jgi:hypothetical protein